MCFKVIDNYLNMILVDDDVNAEGIRKLLILLVKLN